MAESAEDGSKGSGRAWGFLMSWVGRITALTGLVATLAGGVAWWVDHHRDQAERRQQIALAQTQAEAGEYQKAMDTWSEILKRDPLDASARDGQLQTAMLWVENFQVIASEGQNPAEQAAHALDSIFPVLDEAMSRKVTGASGAQAADVQAHLGWAHWLNHHIAAAEFGAAAEENLRRALARDPQNVYANGMLGNWMLQNQGDFHEAVEHLHRAVATGKVRAFVRRLQLGGLVGLNHDGARAELMRVANEMRQGGEDLDPEWRHRAVGFCCDPVVTTRPELVESLSAIPPDQTWQTYLWLEASEDDDSGGQERALVHRYIHANLLDIAGQKDEARGEFRQLQKEMRHTGYSAGASFPAIPDLADSQASHQN